MHHKDVGSTLVNPQKYKYLLPFYSPHSLTSAAKVLDVLPSHMHYHIQRFLAMGLLKEVGVREGRGRKGKLYQATAERFFIPLEYTALETAEDVLYHLQEPTFRDLIRNRVRLLASIYPDMGIGFELSEGGWFNIFLRPLTNSEDGELLDLTLDAIAYSKFLSNVSLGQDAAKHVEETLKSLYNYVLNHQQEEGSNYHMHFSIVKTD